MRIADTIKFDIIKFSLITLVLAVVAWRAWEVNMRMHAYAKDDTYFVYTFKASEPLLSQAKQWLKTDSIHSKQLLEQAYRTDLTSAMPLMLMAQALQQEGQTKQAQQLLALGEQLNPKDTAFQLAVGQFWGAQGQLDRAFLHWSLALDSRPSLGKKLFPVFLTMAESRQYQALFFQKQAQAPNWIDGFFGYALQHASGIDTIRHLAKQYALYDLTMPANIKQAYLDKLMQAGLWTEAYFDWLNALSPAQQTALGNLNNGGFEETLPMDGFAWRYANTKGVQLTQSTGFGISAQAALRVQFLGSATQVAQLAEQVLLLTPGRYSFAGRLRAEQLHLYKGAHWQVICDRGALLAKTDDVQQDIVWTEFNTSFTVPDENCGAQRLQLVLEHALDREQIGMYGTLWYDDLEIKQIVAANMS